jgi:hypothetical protein
VQWVFVALFGAWHTKQVCKGKEEFDAAVKLCSGCLLGGVEQTSIDRSHMLTNYATCKHQSILQIVNRSSV